LTIDAYDATPPHDREAERATLGAMLQRPQAIDDVAELLRGADYYLPVHETIHDVIVTMHAARQTVDAITVNAELQRRGELAKLPDATYVHTLMQSCQMPWAALSYAEVVADTALRRRVMDAGQRSIQYALTAEDANTAAQDAQQWMAEAANTASTTEGGTTLEAGMADAIDWLETQQIGAQTPWVDVNEVTNGLLPGTMITVAARPGHGKSLVLKDVAVFTAKQGTPVHISTLEMSRNEYMARILAAEAKVNLANMLRRRMSEAEWERVAQAAQIAQRLPLYLDDRETQTMDQIRAAARQTQRRYGRKLGLIGIDYAQLVKPDRRLQVREQEVAAISRKVKLMSKEFDCPVMLLAQLNRGNTQRSDHTPQVSDLRESGALEQDSDQVWLLHREDQYRQDTERLGEVDLIVGKNRNGPPNVTIPLAFQGHYARIVSLA
jgi:replicative DNA helicase